MWKTGWWFLIGRSEKSHIVIYCHTIVDWMEGSTGQIFVLFREVGCGGLAGRIGEQEGTKRSDQSP